ncbi:hypothetical protein [Kitasatospora cineracea]|uniref:Carbohydrate binding protein n=1 Tax=Kitasatospora cineracea TaxID=88074 RepID=A0A8G1X7Z7_9ACTN|nr:hypothetical protein [Kitasatospora cineracea]ROR35323.1 hypothetical protein EDD39_6980 [Kitasatospora cineracea]
MHPPSRPRRRHPQRPGRLPLGAAAAAALLTATAGFALLGSGTAGAAQEAVRDGLFAQPLADNWTCTGDVRQLDRGVEGRPGGYDYAGCTQRVTVQPYTTYDLTADVSGAYAFVGVYGGDTEAVYQWADGPEQTRLHAVVRTAGNTRALTVYFHGWYGQGPYQVRRVSLYDGNTSLPACPDMTGAPPSSPLPSPPTPTRTTTAADTAVPPPAATTTTPSPGSSSPTSGPTCLPPPVAVPSSSPAQPRPTET